MLARAPPLADVGAARSPGERRQAVIALAWVMLAGVWVGVLLVARAVGLVMKDIDDIRGRLVDVCSILKLQDSLNEHHANELARLNDEHARLARMLVPVARDRRKEVN